MSCGHHCGTYYRWRQGGDRLAGRRCGRRHRVTSTDCWRQGAIRSNRPDGRNQGWAGRRHFLTRRRGGSGDFGGRCARRCRTDFGTLTSKKGFGLNAIAFMNGIQARQTPCG